MARIAIIGGGVAGLTAGYALHREHQITLFEKSGRVGGNAFTHTTKEGHSFDIAVAAFGRAGYKNFYALLDELGVETSRSRNTSMSFHDLDTQKGMYFAANVRALFEQRFDLLKPRNIVSMFSLMRGLRKAQVLLEAGAFDGLTLDEGLMLLPELVGDARLVFLCSLCLLSSMSAAELLRSPAAFFFTKLRVHNDIISHKAPYSIRVATHGTQSYIDALARGFRKDIVLNATIQKVRREGNRVLLLQEGAEPMVFDQVVFACPAPIALGLLEKPTDEEKRLLGAWKYKAGKIVVHKDYSAFPSRGMMPAFTFLHTHRDGVLDTSVNGATWHLPHVPKNCQYISSQHPNFHIRDELIELETVFHTPVFDAASTQTISQLPSLNGVRNSFYCGSHFGFGLHEDAVTSALNVARRFAKRRAA